MLDIPLEPSGPTASLTGLLREFWARIAAAEDVLMLLQEWADKKPSRRASISVSAVRQEHNLQRVSARWRAKPCIVCAEYASQQHHIIQVQHGGTNRHDNKVWVCTPCHRKIHPQLALPPKTAPVGAVNHHPGTERAGKCAGCGHDIILVQAAYKKRQFPMATTKRPIPLQPGSQPPYTTNDLHQPHCFNKRGLSRYVQADLRRLAKRDVRWAEDRAAGGQLV